MISLLSNILSAQLPTTNVIQLNFEIIGDSIEISDPKYLTEFNSKGYNNQCHTINDEELFISSNWKNPDQTDIYALQLDEEELLRFTATDESEYSPTLTPDKKHISVIRVELDRGNSQVLWEYPIDMSGEGRLLIKELKNIGYHKWLNSDELALFLVNEPNQLVMYKISNSQQTLISRNVGRSFDFYKGKLFNIHKLSRRFWHLKEYDPYTKRSKLVLQSLPDKEDFAITNKGVFLMADDSVLYFYRPGTDKNWKKGIDLELLGIQNISRLHIRGEKLFLVEVK